MMKAGAFQDLLDARGPDLDLWPEADRMAARALLSRSETARRALSEAEALDQALAELPTAGASPLLRSAILDIPEIEGQGTDRTGGARVAGRWSPRNRGIAAGWMAIAASAAIGFAIGAWWPHEPPIWQTEDLVALVYGGPDFDEVLR